MAAERIKTEAELQYETALAKFEQAVGFKESDYNGSQYAREKTLGDKATFKMIFEGTPQNKRISVFVNNSEGVETLNFVLRDSGLESIGSINPYLQVGPEKIALGPVGVGSDGSLLPVKFHDNDEGKFRSIVGAKLADFVTQSIAVNKLVLDPGVAIHFPVYPVKE